MIKVIFCLLLSQISLAAENRKYIRVGQNPINPYILYRNEKVFPVGEDTFLTTMDKNGKRIKGWLSDDYHFVGKRKNGRWEAVRIYECGNPVISPRIVLRDKGLFNPRPDCPLEKKEWFMWTVGPGLIGYGGGVNKKVPVGFGGSLIVIDIFTNHKRRTDGEIRKCRAIKKVFIGAASAGIGWLIGNALRKPESRTSSSGSAGSGGGPGPIPPNGLALSF